VSGGSLTLSSTTLTSGQATGAAGGAGGGAGSVIGSNGTTGNPGSAGTDGAGQGGGVAVEAGTVRVHNTLIAGNAAGNYADVWGTLFSQGHNLLGNSGGSTGLTNGTSG